MTTLEQDETLKAQRVLCSAAVVMVLAKAKIPHEIRHEAHVACMNAEQPEMIEEAENGL